MADISKINVNSTTYNLKDSRIPNLPGTTTTYLRGDGTWTAPTVSTMTSASDVSDEDTYLLITPASGGSGGTVSLQAITNISPTTSSQTITADSGYDGLSSVQINAMPSGSASTPATTITANPSISVSSGGLITATVSGSKSVTPTVSAGYVSAGTAGTVTVSGSNTQQLTTKAAATYTPSTSTQTIAAGQYLTGIQTIDAIPSQYIVPSGNKAITENGTGIDVTDYATVSVNVASSVGIDSKTATASNYPTSLSFTELSGQPKAFTVRLNASVSSSGNTTYYYIVDIASNGTTTHGNCFRVGSTRQVTSITSGYTWSYSGTTLTVSSSASSRSASPGAFYSGSYELLYVY